MKYIHNIKPIFIKLLVFNKSQSVNKTSIQFEAILSLIFPRNIKIYKMKYYYNKNNNSNNH